MFIKQHSVFDVLTAFGLSAIMYILVYRYDCVLALKQRIRDNRKKTRPEAV